MIRWCMYCQKYVGEKAPYLDYSLTHGICDSCFEADRYVVDPTPAMERLSDFYRKLFTTAASGDMEQATVLAQEAAHAGYDAVDIALGFIQPALYGIGEEWARNNITYQDEHRFTAWCRRLLELMPPETPPIKERPDMLLLPVPGNTHTLGAHLAGLSLRSQGLDVRIIMETLPSARIHERVRAEQPRAIGLSCALPSMLQTAVSEIDQLRAKGYPGIFLVGGVACRLPELPFSRPGIVVCRDTADALAALAEGSHSQGFSKEQST